MSTVAGTAPASTGPPPAISGARLLEAWLDDLPMPLSLLAVCVREESCIVQIPFGGGDLAHLVIDPALVAEVLVQRRELFRRDRGFIDSFEPLLGTGLITDEGPAWRERRRWVQAALHRNRGMLEETTLAYAQELMRTWPDGDVHDLSAELSGLHWRILVRTVLGGDGTSQGLADPARSDSSGTVPWQPEWLTLRAGLPLRSEAADNGDLATLLRRSALRDTGAAELRDQLITLLFGGRDTTTSALTWALVALAAHPTIQDRLADELGAALDERSPSYERVAEVPYLRAVIDEALRLYPPTVFVTREPIEDVELGGFRIAAGARLILSPWLTHRDGRNFSAPLEFRPERWQDALARPDAGYFPFGAGPRTCVARTAALTEISLVVAVAVMRFRITLVGSVPVPRMVTTLVPADPVHVRLQDRRR